MSVVLVVTYSLIRILYTVANDGLLPKFWAKCHCKYYTPHRITILVGLIVGLSAAMIPIERIITLANFGAIITYMMVCFSVIYLRHSDPERKRPFRCPAFPLIPILGIVVSATILYGLPNKTFKYAAVWIAFLLAVYFGRIFLDNRLKD